MDLVRTAFVVVAAAAAVVAAAAPDSSAEVENAVWVAAAPALVERFDLEGAGRKLAAAVPGASGVAIDAEGHAWIASAIGLHRLNERGDEVAFHSLPAGAYAVACAPDGAVWITTSVPSRTVEKRTREGETLFVVGFFSNPLGIGVDASGNALVADGGRNELVTISPAGEVIGRVPGGGCGGDLAIDASGHAWTAGPCGTGEILRYASDGTLAGRYRVPLRSIGAISVDALGQVWVAHPTDASVTVLSPEGVEVAAIGVEDAPVAIASDGLGRVWVAGAVGGSLLRADPRTRAIDGRFATAGRPSARGDMTGFAFANATVPGADLDGDGYTNREEIDAGTNPFDRASRPEAWTAGNVNAGLGRAADVLFVNDETGGPRRSPRIASWEPIVVLVDAPPAARGPAGFALYARRGAGVPAEPVELPHGIGAIAFPIPLVGGNAGTVTLANSFSPRRGRRLGRPLLKSLPAPAIVAQRPRGLGRSLRLTLQGLVEDPGSSGPGVSVTNAVFLRVD